jgi:hypothetical protein
MQRFAIGNIPHLLCILSSVVLTGFLLSCTMDLRSYRLYQGPQLPSDQTAKLISKGGKIRIRSVNGRKIPSGKDVLPAVAIEVLPGDYDLTVSFSGSSLAMAYGENGRYKYNIYYTHQSVDNVDIALATEAGHTYLVTSSHNYEESTWYAVIRDNTTDKRILKNGPYPLDKIRTGDNRDARRILQD